MISTRYELEKVFGVEAVKMGTIDALTMSYNDSLPFDVVQTLYHCITTLQRRGFITRPWYGNGYKGFRIGSLRFGVHQRYSEKSLVMVSGDLTSMVAHEVHRVGRCTRIDFAYDIMVSKGLDTCRRIYEDWFNQYDSDVSQADNRNLYKSRNGGFTVTRGQRGKGVFIRVYDKGAEQALSRNWWFRFEVEVKNPWAQSAYNKWLESDNPTAYCVAMVDYFMEKRGMPLLSDLIPPLVEVELTRLVAVDAELERKMVFLTKTVKPFLHRLKNYVTVEEILNLLEL